ncbi:molybdate transport system ATP-binding protein [Arcicella aurantiaca]|uniref:Molybdate transport system ATP-binding protein n=1 Tax=Arcicella aurantiaca TaxID=591202 RepID=A0A316E843_9BACT|nr:ATP-binding cassette domain-containing protein [Arcicella aurantiaca]PWK26541.1 molybdate transport system ATP-binding protein [Arcicella aurantiaca]
MPNHQAIFLSNEVNKQAFIQQILSQKAIGILVDFNELEGTLFSKIKVDEILDEEDRHGFTEVTKSQNRSLKSMSSGEQKKALLDYLMATKVDYIILDNPFDNLDVKIRESLLNKLIEVQNQVVLIQIIHRKRDLLPFINNFIAVENDNKFHICANSEEFMKVEEENLLVGNIPNTTHIYSELKNELIVFDKVNVSYNERPILKDITWTIGKGEFWHLIGPNGAGKTTILSMITGDNPKGYGQSLFLFGRKKGSGETVWDIKDKIGYVTPSMTDLFSTRHTLEQMVVSGFYDSIGLYVNPSDLNVKLAKEWLALVNMSHLANTLFCFLTSGQQRLALILRAMVKHPPLMILDEAIAGLDDHNTRLAIALINKIANETNTTILYVSHRNEEGLNPKSVFTLNPSENGSVGVKS